MTTLRRLAITPALLAFSSLAFVAFAASAVAAPIPTVTTGSASNIVTGKVPEATLSGQVEPLGAEITSCYLEIRGEQHYEMEYLAGPGFIAHHLDVRTVPCAPAAPYSSSTHVSVNVSNLYLGTTYEYRLVASTPSQTVEGQFQRFRVPGLPIANFSAISSTTQAGGHPDIRTRFDFANREAQDFPTFPTRCFCQDARTVVNHLPTGVIGNPHAVPYCSPAQLGTVSCPPDSQVGTIWTEFLSGDFFSPLYNIEPDPNQAGLLGFEFPFTNSPAFIELSARTGSDYGLDATLANVPQTVPPEGSVVNLWGVPADPSHDAYRVAFGAECGESLPPEELEGAGNVPCPAGTPSTSPRIPFLENPTACGEPLTSGLEILAYDTGTSFAESPYPATTGCDQLSFNPSLSAQPTTSAADSPSGLEVDLSVPQQQSPEVPSPSEIRAATIKLPAGFSINSGAADGKSACSDVQARLGTPNEAQCPETAKIGTVTLNSSALPGVVPGFVYLLEPKQGDRYRILLSANGFATHVKLLGSVTPDPETGQLITSFPNLPQSPVTDFNIHFFGSERGLLATPTQCGKYAVESTFTPWDSALPAQSSTQFFNVTSGPGASPCPGLTRPFSPSLQASVLDGTGGTHSPFTLELTRPDGDQNLSALNIKTPPGFSATLRGIPYCPDAALAAAAAPGYSGLSQQANPSCPAASQIGTAQAGAGAGTHPVYLPGKVYLAGPYKGAPLSLAVITPAVSGPYDLGNVVIRAALHVNPETAQITAVSDPLPQILEGIPLRLRSLRVDLNRPGFTLNPTNCDPFSVNSEVFGSEGALAGPSTHFQVANCRTLPFAPKLALKLTGSTKQAGNPALTATLTAKPGEANISRTEVTLPRTELVDNAHINSPCTRVQFNEGKTPGEKCPAGSILGFAEADTPLLERPLEGPIYLRTTGRAGLPDVVAALNGQIDIVLDGRVNSVHGGLRTTFETVPDAPVTRVVLSFDGGHKGLIENSPQLCAHLQHFTASITGQNGKTVSHRPVLSTSCGKKHQHKARAHHNRRAR